jgi:hypothetical protein
METAPVVLFVYNRPHHTKLTIESLVKNTLADKSKIFIFSDGPKNLKDEKLVNEVREYIKSVKGFEQINIIENKVNKGLANSVIDGVTSIIKRFGKAVVVEDDLESSLYFLKFMNEALDFYKNENIYSISGYSLPIKIPADYNENVYIIPRSSSWGWATWLNRWEKADWEVKDFIDFRKDKNSQKLFNNGGEDLTPMLVAQMSGKIDSWGIRWAYSHFKNNSYCLYPVKSFIKNIGIDNSGTHSRSRSSTKFDVELAGNKDFSFTKDVKLNSDILESVRRIVKPGFRGKIINTIKGF